MLFFAEGFTFRNFLVDAFAIFVFVVWFWLLITVLSDLFRRHDISGWAKAIWVIALIAFSYLGIFAYMITQGRRMAERRSQQAPQARHESRRVAGFSVADDSEKHGRVKEFGSGADQVFMRLRAQLVQEWSIGRCCPGLRSLPEAKSAPVRTCGPVIVQGGVTHE